MNLQNDCVTIRCNNEQEWIDIQKYLFSIGLEWSMGKEIVFPYNGYEYPLCIWTNFLDKYLCHSPLDDIDKYDLKFYTTAKKILRKQKLEKWKSM